ncbi:MAG: amidohydrolase family protein [Planctomycetes bacterium]|nr:amidohydrolase family protein [Planctomycetota bacterium]
MYESHGLLQPGTLLAHAIHLSDDEWRLAQLRDVVLVHCPTANTFLESGAFDWATARRHGIRVALGSDRAAGPDIAMPRVARAMIETCKWRNLMARQAGRDDSLSVPSAADAWRLITTGNADALGWSDAGRLEPGAAADILLLQPGRSFPFDPDDPHLISRLLYNWSDEIIDHVVLNGTLIHRAAMLRNA